jgi:hypothetical protein
MKYPWLLFSFMNRWGLRCVCRVIISHVKNATSLKYRLEGNFVLNMMRLEGKSEVRWKMDRAHYQRLEVLSRFV